MVSLQRSARRSRESGQAAVEAALTLPLTLFMILGTVQLFMMLQGRIFAEYAAFRATRAGSLNHGDCTAMEHAAILALMPTIHSFVGTGDPGQGLAEAFGRRKNNKFHKKQDNVSGTILWILRETPDKGSVPNEQTNFDQGTNTRLETRLIYFFPMRIPVVNYIISRIVLARWGWLPYDGQDHLVPVRRTQYESGTSPLSAAIRGQVMSRYSSGEYIVPIIASGSMRMMTPAQARYFKTQHCSAPDSE